MVDTLLVNVTSTRGTVVGDEVTIGMIVGVVVLVGVIVRVAVGVTVEVAVGVKVMVRSMTFTTAVSYPPHSPSALWARTFSV